MNWPKKQGKQAKSRSFLFPFFESIRCGPDLGWYFLSEKVFYLFNFKIYDHSFGESNILRVASTPVLDSRCWFSSCYMNWLDLWSMTISLLLLCPSDEFFYIRYGDLFKLLQVAFVSSLFCQILNEQHFHVSHLFSCNIVYSAFAQM